MLGGGSTPLNTAPPGPPPVGNNPLALMRYLRAFRDDPIAFVGGRFERYGDLLIKGDKSEFVGEFDGDSLQTQIGAASKSKRAKKLGKTAKFTWKDSITDDVPLVFATAEGGALVAVTLQENEIVRPAIAGAAITATGAVKVLAEVTSSMTGIEANYQYQLLFYVPALGSSEKIRLLGYSYALTSARKLR
jgi:hypothetical protein